MSSIDPRHAPAIGACTEDTLQIDEIFPVLPCDDFRGHSGFAVHAYNVHSKVLQPVGTWHQSKESARKERGEILDLLDLEAT